MPERMKVALGRAQPVEQIVVRRLWRVARDEVDRVVVQRAGRLALGVANDPAARRIGRRPIDPGDGEGRGIGPTDMAVVALQQDRSVGDDGIEQRAVGLATRETPAATSRRR